jgi:hypothetical protein
MAPTQIIEASVQRKLSESEQGNKNPSAIHNSVSERHKPNMSGKIREHEKNKRVIIATKSEMREMRDNPHMMHYELLYKDAIPSTNDMTSLHSVISHVLQAYNDVFPEEIPAGLPPLRGIEHQIDLILGASLPNRPPYRTIHRKPRKFSDKCKNYSTKSMYVKALVLVLSLLFLFQRKMVLGECVLIVELLTTSLSDIDILFLGLMICLMNLVVLLFSLKLTYVADTIKLE